jgi:phosphotriesterase-related protein
MVISPPLGRQKNTFQVLVNHGVECHNDHHAVIQRSIPMQAQTVLGPVPAEELGLTLMHEHLLFDLRTLQAEPGNDQQRLLASQPVNPSNRGALRFNPILVRDNLFHQDIDLAIKEVADFTNIGGRTLVDPTCHGMGRNPESLQAIAHASGLNIIMGSGYYIDDALHQDFAARKIDDIMGEIIFDIQSGVGPDRIKSGLIGEIGTSSPIRSNEEKSLRAAARAQAATGAPLMIHLDGWAREGQQAIDIALAEGVDPARIILCHMNPSYQDRDYQISLAEQGVFLEFDMFGNDHVYPIGASPPEALVLSAISSLIENGWIKQILISQDVFLKMMLRMYGGYGYAHLFTNLPQFFADSGISKPMQKIIFGDNPARALSFLNA